ncbi:hypothetical protein WJX75_003343 [Coccomyxa subellipsoidea]|uniref:Uncharacterized protein n=1 Tax=Coccomyxa subellipsoidea TaxID=248742 RepID=A0ABR2YJ54_9CHLO
MAGSIEAVSNSKDQDLLIKHGYSGYPIKVAYSNGERKYTYNTDVGQASWVYCCLQPNVVLKLEQWSGRNGKLPAPAIFGLSKSQKPFYRPAIAALVAVPPVQAPSPPGGAIPELVAQWKATEVCGNWQHFKNGLGPHIFISLERQGQPTRRIEMDDRGCVKVPSQCAYLSLECMTRHLRLVASRLPGPYVTTHEAR